MSQCLPRSWRRHAQRRRSRLRAGCAAGVEVDGQLDWFISDDFDRLTAFAEPWMANRDLTCADGDGDRRHGRPADMIAVDQDIGASSGVDDEPSLGKFNGVGGDLAWPDRDFCVRFEVEARVHERHFVRTRGELNALVTALAKLA